MISHLQAGCCRVFCSFLHRFFKLGAVAGLGNANRGAQVGRLDEQGIGSNQFGFSNDRGKISPDLLTGEHAIGEHGDSERLNDLLANCLVHGDGRTKNAGADVGDILDFQQALQGAILTISAVENREDNIHRGQDDQLVVLPYCQLDTAAFPQEQGFIKAVGLLVFEGFQGIGACFPDTVVGDTHFVDGVFFVIQRAQDRTGGLKGDLVFA